MSRTQGEFWPIPCKNELSVRFGSKDSGTPASRGSPQYLMPAGPGGSLREARGRQDAKYDVEKMKDNSEPEEDRGVETDYSAEEAEQMGAVPRSSR